MQHVRLLETKLLPGAIENLPLHAGDLELLLVAPLGPALLVAGPILVDGEEIEDVDVLRREVLIPEPRSAA